MSSEFVEILDLTGKDAQKVEDGDRIPAGWHFCFVNEFDRDEEKKLIFEFKVIGGPHAGETITEKLSDPGSFSDPKAQKVSINRRLLFAKRLGLIPDTAYGKQHPIDWWDSVNREVWIKTESRTYKKKDGGEGKAVGMTFDGIYSADDPRVPAEAKRGLDGDAGATADVRGPAPSGSGTSAAATPPTATTNGTTARPPAKRKDFGDL